LNTRIKQQLEFIVEIDKIKSIFRHTKLFDGSRRENDAEHSWHLAMMALVLAEHANEPVDVVKVVKMVLVHDIVEIDAGDYIIYTKLTAEKEAKEKAAAERIFGLLPEEQKDEFYSLWREFEERRTPEAKFAAAIDRLEPVMQNYYTQGAPWRENNVPAEHIYSINHRIAAGSETLWEYAKSLIDECVAKGLIKQ
jgi:putative hydrolase of HD superfamily